MSLPNRTRGGGGHPSIGGATASRATISNQRQHQHTRRHTRAHWAATDTCFLGSDAFNSRWQSLALGGHQGWGQ
eukprot:1157566-Pelagomonas_calceolata.AAC.1